MRFTILLLILSIVCSTGCETLSALPQKHLPKPSVEATQPVGDYQIKLKAIETERKKLALEFHQSADKKAVLVKAEKLFVSSIDAEIFPYWYGTDWDFYGTTQIPKSGQIACGYFVSTVLRDAGVKLNRVTIAQQASENIIKSLTTESFINRFRNVAIDKFVEEIFKLGAGLYIVGLDNHVGFILNDGNNVYFVHSSYLEPSEVVKEIALTSPILSSSKYRVVGKISADDSFLRKWLNQSNFITRTR